MLSISQASNSLLCIEWVPTESGPKVINYKKISYDFTSNINFLDFVLKNFDIKYSDSANRIITLSLDVESVCLTSFRTVPEIELNDRIDWYENNFLGKYIVDNNDIYYYPIKGEKNDVMVVYIDKDFRKNIFDSCDKHNYKLKHLGLGVFSANDIVRIYNNDMDNKYVLWKIGKGNTHYLLYCESGDVKHYMKIKSNKKVECIQSIGDDCYKSNLMLLADSVFNNNVDINNTLSNKIYLYQSKSNFDSLKKIYNRDKNNIIIMDIGFRLLNKTSRRSNQYNLLSYNENGNSLRGIDV